MSDGSKYRYYRFSNKMVHYRVYDQDGSKVIEFLNRLGEWKPITTKPSMVLDEIRKGEFIVPMLESDMMHVREDVCNNAWAYVDVPDAEFKT